MPAERRAQFCSNRVDFLQYIGDRRKKMMDQNFEIRILWYLRIFWFEIFKKASRGPSAADVDHYGRGQTRSQQGPCDQVSSKSVNVEG